MHDLATSLRRCSAGSLTGHRRAATCSNAHPRRCCLPAADQVKLGGASAGSLLAACIKSGEAGACLGGSRTPCRRATYAAERSRS